MSNQERQARYNAKNTRIEIVFNSDDETDQDCLIWLDKLKLESNARSHSQVIKALLQKLRHLSD